MCVVRVTNRLLSHQPPKLISCYTRCPSHSHVKFAINRSQRRGTSSCIWNFILVQSPSRVGFATGPFPASPIWINMSLYTPGRNRSRVSTAANCSVLLRPGPRTNAFTREKSRSHVVTVGKPSPIAVISRVMKGYTREATRVKLVVNALVIGGG